MPTPPRRLSHAAACAVLLGVLPVATAALDGFGATGVTATASAEAPSPTPGPTDLTSSPTPAGRPTCALIDPAACVGPGASGSPSPDPTATSLQPTAATPTRTPRPHRRHRPQAAVIATAAPSGAESPVGTGSSSVSPVVPQSPLATPSLRAAGTSRSGAPTVTRLVVLVLGGAVLLGVGGAAGLYVTRHPHEH